MQECDIACDRIAVLVHGQFQCMGTLQHLKTKYGQGMTLKLKIPEDDWGKRSKIEAIVNELFPDSSLAHYYQVRRRIHNANR